MLAAPIVLAGCALRHRHRPAPTASPLHSVLGPPYQINGMWRYPHASYEYDETGLAEIATMHGPFATDGAQWDPAALMAAHPTLQLPAVVRVTNLETGRQILLRLDDRGPAAPGRLLALTPRAASLLGAGSEPGVLRVRVVVEDGPSRHLTAELGDPEAPPLAVMAAPAGDVRTETLGPPGSHGGVSPQPLIKAAVPPALAPLRLSETVVDVPVAATSLWIDAGGLGNPRYAQLLRVRLAGFGALVVRDPAARPELAYRVRVGPFATAAAADVTLDQILRAGVVDARIIVL